LRRSHALEAIAAVERRMKADVAAAAAIARQIASRRQHNHHMIGHALGTFNIAGLRSAFACAVVESHRAMLTTRDRALADGQCEADARVRAARDAMLPWAQMRCGLERRRARLAAATFA
jgi:rRNA-processing protein FCF1